MSIMPLSEDMLNFLSDREVVRRAAAPPIEEGEEDGVTAEPSADECGIYARDEDPANADRAPACADFHPAELSLIEEWRDANGWPSADNLYADLNELLARAVDAPEDTDTMARVVELQRQINLLESYRKMLLHKQQGACAFIGRWCSQTRSSPALDDEIEALALNRQ